MFDPRDFFEISKKLYNVTSSEDCNVLSLSKYKEALLRTIASRAYYSVYLTCREWLKRQFRVDVNKESQKREKSVHTTIKELILERTGMYYLVDYIDELKNFRELSDYDLTVNIDVTDVQRCLSIAEEVLDDIG